MGFSYQKVAFENGLKSAGVLGVFPVFNIFLVANKNYVCFGLETQVL